MKNNLGKMILFVLVLWGHSTLHAQDFTYQFHVNKLHPYVKEAVLLTLDINQTSPDKVLLFNFDIVKNNAYTFQRVDIKETTIDRKARVKYVYLIYPLKPGDISIDFELLKKVTTEENVVYSISGDRDNIKGLVSVDTIVNLPPLHLNVQKLPADTLLVGDFTLTHAIKKHKAQAYEPLPMQVSITGQGYPPLIETLLPKEGNFTRFIEQPIVKSVVNPQGTHSTVTYAMALSAVHSFTLPPLSIKAFNPDTQESYLLTLPQQKFDITTPSAKELLDTIDSPALITQDWSWISTFFSYLIVFSAGYFSALSWKWTKKHQKKEENPLKTKIQNCTNEKMLLQLLISIKDIRFNASIEQLEDSLYRGAKIPFNKVKQDLQEKIL